MFRSMAEKKVRAAGYDPARLPPGQYLTKKWADTYNGPDLRNFKDLQLLRADETGFCIQVVKEAQVFRLVGPGGKPEPGRC